MQPPVPPGFMNAIHTCAGRLSAGSRSGAGRVRPRLKARSAPPPLPPFLPLLQPPYTQAAPFTAPALGFALRCRLRGLHFGCSTCGADTVSQPQPMGASLAVRMWLQGVCC